MIERRIETGRCYGMEMNLERTEWEFQRNDLQKQLESVEHFNYSYTMIRKDARHARKIKHKTGKEKAAFNKKTLLTWKLYLI